MNTLELAIGDEDMADVGRALMQAIEAHAPKGWHPADCPSEIVGDLAGENDELRTELAALKEAIKTQSKPIGYFCDVNTLTPEQGKRIEQVCESAKDDTDVFPLYTSAPTIPTIPEGLDNVLSFAREIMNDVWPMGDIDGEELQDMAVKHGLLTPEIRYEPCHEERCACAENVNDREFSQGITCYRKAQILLSASPEHTGEQP